MKLTVPENGHEPRQDVYHSFLLRLWRPPEGDCCWRASLEDARTGRRIGFPGLEELFTVLMQETESDGDENGAQNTQLPDRSRGLSSSL